MQMNLATVHTNQLNAPIDISYLWHRMHVCWHTYAHRLSEVKALSERIYQAMYKYRNTHK